MNFIKKTKLWRGLIAVFSFFFILFTLITVVAFDEAGSIDIALGIGKEPLTGDVEYVYPSKYGDITAENLEKLLADEDAYNIRTMEEGAVLLKNNGALPFTSEDGTKVTLFGRAVADPVYRSRTGGATNDPTRAVSFYDAVKAAGYSINDTLFDAYKNSSTKRDLGGGSYSKVTLGTAKIGEEKSAFYTSELKDTFSQYGDLAIVMLSRAGAEGIDLQTRDSDGISQLALHPAEKDLFTMIKSYKNQGLFKKVVVLLNTGNPMELDWLDEEQYGVDACLWIGQPGLNGFTGVVNILTGKANPSGQLTDVYAADSMSAPAMQNFGDFTFANKEDTYVAGMSHANNDCKYVIYAEGIYTGYKYYETRYADAIEGSASASGNAGVFASKSGWNYAEEMTFPFGYGLSYTTFEQKLDSLVWDRNAKTVTANVTVTNTGSVAGRSVVELYVQAPYTDYDKLHLVEKSAIQLIGFGKTGILAPKGEEGDSQTVEIVVDEYLFASYDANEAKTYIYDDGEYYFSIGDDAHDALNNVLAARGFSGLYDADGNPVDGDADKVVMQELTEFDNTTYAVSQYTGAQVSNRFDDVDINHFVDDGGTEVTYLTRQDWTTFPRSYTDIVCTPKMDKLLDIDSYEVPAELKNLKWDDFKQGVDNGINFVEMKDVPFSGKFIDKEGVERDADELWDKFLDQLTLEDLYYSLADNKGIPAATSVNRPDAINNDGPDGWGLKYVVGDKGFATNYVCGWVLASTWSEELLELRGFYEAEDALFTGGVQMWSPGANLHRSPFGGRNFEYYSEDSIFSYICAGIEVKAMQEHGVMSAIKHFCANDQETNRLGVCVFANEQAFRQGPMKGFEGAFTVGGALGTMTSYNRIGCAPDHCKGALLNTVLRGEWGFKGMTITDAQSPTSDNHAMYALQNGTDMWCIAGKAYTNYKKLLNAKNPYALYVVRQANKNIHYAYAHSNLINGLGADSQVSNRVSWWQPTMIVIDVIFGVLAVGAIVLFLLGGYVFREKEKEQ